MPTLKIGTTEIPIPVWSTSVFAVMLCLGASFYGYRYFYPLEPELISVRKANETLRQELEEYNRHIMDEPVASIADASSKVNVRVFDDGCLLVSRRNVTRLLLASAFKRSEASRLGLVTLLHAEAKCLNPHPGKFQAQNGQKVDACWLPVYRTFEDGCQHVQMFNTCSGGWATNVDGTPQVKWMRCVH